MQNIFINFPSLVVPKCLTTGVLLIQYNNDGTINFITTDIMLQESSELVINELIKY